MQLVSILIFSIPFMFSRKAICIVIYSTEIIYNRLINHAYNTPVGIYSKGYYRDSRVVPAGTVCRPKELLWKGTLFPYSKSIGAFNVGIGCFSVRLAG